MSCNRAHGKNGMRPFAKESAETEIGKLWRLVRQPPTDILYGETITINIKESEYSFEILIDDSDEVVRLCASAGLSPTSKGYGTWGKYRFCGDGIVEYLASLPEAVQVAHAAKAICIAGSLCRMEGVLDSVRSISFEIYGSNVIDHHLVIVDDGNQSSFCVGW